MLRFKQKDLTASFYYSGRKYYVTAGTHAFDKGLEVTLEYDQVQENAHHLLLRMRNTGSENTWQIKRVKTLDLTIPGAEQLLYHSLTGDDGRKDNFFPIDTVITDTYQAHPNGGRSSSWLGTPYFDLQWGGHSAVFAVGWTGQWLADFRIDGEGAHVRLGLEYGDFYLKPGEDIRLASALVVTGEDVKSTRHAFRRIMREHYSPKTFLGDKLVMPISPQCFDRYTAGMGGSKKDPSYATENGQYRMVDAAMRIKHFNTLWLDAAWFVGGFPKGVGNYRFHEGFPNGLKPVSDYAHKHGLKFLLWFEPERVSVSSDTALLEDKLLKRVHKEMRIINLGDDQVRAWLKDKLITMIRDNGVDYYRQDFNADPLPYWLAEDEEGRQGITEIKYIMGLYDLWDTLQATFPDLLIDNCASGGRRLDLEATRRTVTLWKSDIGCLPEDEEHRVTAWNQNQTLALCDYLPHLGGGVWEPDSYTVRSTAMHGITCTFDYFNPELDVNQAERILDEVTEMSPYWNMDFHPLTKPTLAEDVWARFQLGDAAKGAMYAFRRVKSEESEQLVAFEAVDPARTYHLTFIDEHLNRTEQDVPGAALASGIPVTIPHPRNSLIIKYQVI